MNNNRSAIIRDAEPLRLTPEISKEIQTRLDWAIQHYPSALSKDRKAFLVDGSIGYGCYISPSGDAFMETYDLGGDTVALIDRSRVAQIAVLILGSRTIPELSELLPLRPPEASTCRECEGGGWVGPDQFRFLCRNCFGLGWEEPNDPA